MGSDVSSSWNRLRQSRDRFRPDVGALINEPRSALPGVPGRLGVFMLPANEPVFLHARTHAHSSFGSVRLSDTS
jgi:hypothetical protein